MNWDKTAKWLCILSALVWMAALMYKYFNFGYYDWDLAFFSQAMWQLAHGSAWSSLFGINFFGNHANLIALVITPLYAVFPHPMLLVFLKICSVTIAGWVVFRIAQKRIGGEYALWVLLLFFTYAPNIFGLLYEFDMESLAPGMIALAYYFYVERRWAAFMAMIFLAALIKENIALVVAMFGVAGLLGRKDKWRWGIVPVALGAGIFIIMVKVIVPFYAGRSIGADHPYMGQYAYLGSSLTGILGGVISDPSIIIKKFSDPLYVRWFHDLFGSLLFLPCLVPWAMFFVLPVFAQHFLSTTDTQHTIFYGYSLTLAPFIFFALIAALAWFRKFAPARMFFIMSLIVIVQAVSLLHHWPGMIRRYKPVYTERWNDVRRDFLKMIPQDEPVAASFCFLPALSGRKDVYAFYKVYAKHWNRDGDLFVLPAHVRWALLDFSDIFYQQELQMDKDFVQGRIDSFFNDGGWQMLERQGPVCLLRRDNR